MPSPPFLRFNTTKPSRISSTRKAFFRIGDAGDQFLAHWGMRTRDYIVPETDATQSLDLSHGTASGMFQPALIEEPFHRTPEPWILNIRALETFHQIGLLLGPLSLSIGLGGPFPTVVMG